MGNGANGVVRTGGGHTRRRLLGVTVGTAIGVAAPAGCGLFGDDPEPPAPDPLQPVLDEARALSAAYERAVATQPSLAKRLDPLAADHRAHLEELVRVIGRNVPSAAASSAPAGSDPGETLSGLRSAERRAQRTAAALARQVPAERAALVGSIAACRGSHAEALR